MARGTLHKCVNFQWRKFEPVYGRRYQTRAGSERNGVKRQQARHFVRIGWLCDTCGFHSDERPGQIPRYSDAERVAFAFAVADSETLDDLKELAANFGLEIQLAAPQFDTDYEVDHGNS